MVSLPKDIIEALNDPETVKVLTTTQRDGRPHAAFTNTLTALNENTLAYLELFELSQTYGNILHHFWEKRRVSVAVYNARMNINCHIEGLPKRLLTEGPVWRLLLEETWKVLPEANPAGVWLITPQHVVDQSYPSMLAEMERKRASYSLWWSYLGEHSLEE